ncbi:LEA type 2 family protein [Pseudoxanthomonas putridarboris]|uniref:LEA type 2 family protein n=1 Tax=Pseudoxanthomonas putridarboris TaxID=752605 RepID=A0ABU9IYP8_9GAMM
MMRRWSLAVLIVAAAFLAGCGDGRVRRVSDPAASIQQLTVNADGRWSVDLRLQNYSSIPMRFDTVTLAVQVGEQDAGTLQATPGLSIGPESADVVTLPFAPSSAARIVVADSLAGRRPLPYTLKGSVGATPEEAKLRNFDVDTRNTLNPVPGLDGVLR